MRTVTPMTLYTGQWLVNKAYTSSGLISKPSYKKELKACNTVEDVKALVWNKTRRHITNMEAYKKGQKQVDYEVLLEIAKDL